MPTGFDIEALKPWIGREEQASEVLTAALLARYRATFDMPEPAGASAEVAPQLIHWCLAQPAAPTAALGDDGHPSRGGFLPPVPLPRRMWAGGSVTFGRELRAGDTVTRVSRIAGVAAKEGRTGPLCFVTIEHRFEVAGEVAVTERQDIVYREHDRGTTPRAEPVATAAPQGETTRRIEPSAALLFRYSALTFNGHRIHYDQPYVTKVEGYPGLIVHGPLQACLLLNLATELAGGRALRTFSFRSSSPLFDTADVMLHASRSDALMRLWTARDGGPFAMQADAAW